MNPQSRLKAACLALSIAGTPALMTGCSTAGEGAVSGAGIGALTGLVFGSMVGDAGEGAVLGAASGAVIGGVIGDQNDRQARNSARQADAYRDAARYERYRSDPYRSSSDPYRRDRDRNWGDRYERYESRGDHYRYERYEEYRSEPRVIIRHETRPIYRRYHRSGVSWGVGFSTGRACW